MVADHAKEEQSSWRLSTEPGQRWPGQGSNPRHHAAEMTATEEYGSGQANPGVYEAAALCVEQ